MDGQKDDGGYRRGQNAGSGAGQDDEAGQGGGLTGVAVVLYRAAGQDELGKALDEGGTGQQEAGKQQGDGEAANHSIQKTGDKA